MRSTKLPSWISRLTGLDPVPAPPHVFALDEGQLRYGSFHSTAQGYTFATESSEGLPAEVFGSGLLGAPLRDPQLFSELVAGFVSRLAGPITAASLIVPDAWMRLTFTEITEIPTQAKARDEILRFKLKRLVPFRVEDLRLSAVEVTPFPNQEEPRRLLLGFAIDVLLNQLEDAFATAGVTLGGITNTTMALVASLERAAGSKTLVGLVTVHEAAYTLSFFRDGEPLLYRYKPLKLEMPDSAQRQSVSRDLHMTTHFLHEQFPEHPVARLFLAAPPQEENRWLSWLGEDAEVVAEPLAFEHFPLTRTQVGPSWLETAPLLGAVMLEVS